LNRKSFCEPKLENLAGNIVDRINERQSGSSRIASDNSHSSSEVANMTQGIIDKLPQQYSISPSEQSFEGEIADRVVPVDASPRSNTTNTSLGDQFIKAVVNQSIILGEEETVSGASSLAEEFVAKSIPYALQSTKTGESSVAEMLVAKSVLQGQFTQTTGSSLGSQVVEEAITQAKIDDQSTESSFVENVVAKSVVAGGKSTISTKSSFAEKIVASGWKEGEKQALSKSPNSSLAEDIVRNISPLMSSRSAGSQLADDMLEHVKDDLNPHDLVRDSSAKTRTTASQLASDITHQVLEKIDEN